MNFKSWLLTEEEEKDINLSNPNLTTTKISSRELESNRKVKALGIRYQELGEKYPPEFSRFLSTKRAAYKDYTTNTKSIGAIWYPSDIEVAEKNGLPKNWMGSQIEIYKSKNEKESNKQVEALGIRYQELGRKYPPEFKVFLQNKRSAYRDLLKGIKSTYNLYPSDIEVAEKNGLPKNWMDSQVEIVKSKNEQKNNDRFKELAYYFGRKNAGPSKNDTNPDIASLGIWHNGKKHRKINPSDDKTWAEIVSEFPKWIDPDTKQPFIYTNLPIDWRTVRPNLKQEEEQENSSENFKELAYYYGRKGAGPSKNNTNPDIKYLGKWHAKKKNELINPFKESDDKTWANMVKLSKTENWIDPVTKKPFLYTNLPDDWRDVKSNAWQEYLQKNQKTSSENLEKLAYYYGEKGSAPSAFESIPEDKSLGQWLNKKKRINPNLYEESDKETWNRMVELSKTWDKQEFPYELPEDWREVKPAGEKSLGEKLVLNILTELGIETEPEYRDKACKNKRCLPFDFLITHNGKKYLEFHGGQHYYPVYFGSTEEKTDQIIAKHAIDKFEYTKENDTKKYEHCVKENIPFLVIPYWLYKNPDIIKSKIIEFLNTNEFKETFAKPDVPPEYKVKHDKIYEKFLAESKPTELVDPKPTTQEPTKTFEQFLINKNFINI